MKVALIVLAAMAGAGCSRAPDFSAVSRVDAGREISTAGDSIRVYYDSVRVTSLRRGER